MRLIVGLGNPGAAYVGTPHNLGFEVVSRLATSGNLGFRSSLKFKGVYAKGIWGGKELIFLKPVTYMNLSGESVFRVVRYYNISPEKLLVVTDDINLPIGRLRFREKGSHGGHKGLASIIHYLGTEDFPRLRIGIKPLWDVTDYVGYVLAPFQGEEREKIITIIPLAAGAVEYYLEQGFAKAANRYNGQDPFEGDETEKKSQINLDDT